ncbi:hypothetical protein CEXT_117641 [Caerostris extrusa]|uniref:Uncharacterized protein n=1 Tax=Caerostris extrusa TaxID=172846 RepID=A0AAV4QX26_CAEEX|nr:hypothetical protein CEXT_117641 [Caerostris extrusa]
MARGLMVFLDQQNTRTNKLETKSFKSRSGFEETTLKDACGAVHSQPQKGMGVYSGLLNIQSGLMNLKFWFACLFCSEFSQFRNPSR